MACPPSLLSHISNMASIFLPNKIGVRLISITESTFRPSQATKCPDTGYVKSFVQMKCTSATIKRNSDAQKGFQIETFAHKAVGGFRRDLYEPLSLDLVYYTIPAVKLAMIHSILVARFHPSPHFFIYFPNLLFTLTWLRQCPTARFEYERATLTLPVV